MFYDKIQDCDCAMFRARRGESGFNTIWEALGMLVAIRLWMPERIQSEILLKSDNLAALSAALKFKAKDPSLNAVAREIALDVCEGKYEVNLLEHIPGITNIIPDVLSRVYSPDPLPWPKELTGVRQRDPPSRDSAYWRTWHLPA